MKTSFHELFDNRTLSFDKLGAYRRQTQRRKPYIVLFTARSGSSYLADLLTRTGNAGKPGEYLNPVFLPKTLEGEARRGTRIETIVDYLLWLYRRRSTANGGFGFKATEAHYRPFVLAGLDRLFFSDYALFHLYRNNIVNQAVSLYILAETSVAHTNKEIAQEMRVKVNELSYSGEQLRKWVKHLWLQEVRIRKYIQTLDRDVAVIEYQQLSIDPAGVLNTILQRIGAPRVATAGESSFKRVRSEKNDALAKQFLAEEQNLKFLAQLGIQRSRLEGD